jgi:hypothetical protein
MTTVPFYDGTGYLQLNSDGDLQLTSDIGSEILERLRSRRGTFPFDPEYGSNLYKLVNSKGISSGVITSWVKDALEPMVKQGRLQENIQVNPVKIGTEAIINITVRDSDNNLSQLSLKSFLLS